MDQPPLSEKLQRTREHVAYHLDGLRKAFKPGHKITVLVRFPEHPDRDFVMTDDELPEVTEMIRRRAASF